MAEAGMPRCPFCKGRLRPRELELLCVLAIVGMPVAIVYNLMGVARDFWSIPDIILAAALLPVAIYLLRGSYRAWQAMLGLFIATPVSLIAMIVIAEVIKDVSQASILTGMLLMRTLGVALLWVYFTTQSVRDFAALGKPEEAREETTALFPEQNMQRLRAGKFTSNIR